MCHCYNHLQTRCAEHTDYGIFNIILLLSLDRNNVDNDYDCLEWLVHKHVKQYKKVVSKTKKIPLRHPETEDSKSKRILEVIKTETNTVEHQTITI